ncbi:MAG TPA: YdcF family protein [Planctomycetaceae bacterium]|jgi:uncharacterized SAM-binding protein YcdF (DUF218 family)
MKSVILRRCTRRRLLAVICLAAVLIVYLLRFTILTCLGQWLNVGQRLDEPVDAVMVLGGGALTRPFVAVEILRAGLARKILISRPELSDENRDGLIPSELEIMRQIVLRSGIATDSIVLMTTVVDSTEREAQVAAEYLKNHPAERLAIVTNDYHTRRTRWLFKRTCGSNFERLVFISAPTDDFDGSNWWRYESGLILYVDEYLKLAKTLIR